MTPGRFRSEVALGRRVPDSRSLEQESIVAQSLEEREREREMDV